jgi:hypothetical protein
MREAIRPEVACRGGHAQSLLADHHPYSAITARIASQPHWRTSPVFVSSS